MIWTMLRNPAYAGRAAYGKTRMVKHRARMTRTSRQRGERHGGQACERVDPEQWIHIPVPALIDEDTFTLAAERLERNKRTSPRNTRRPSLLQGILVCAGCGSAYHRAQTTTRQRGIYHYYRCSGTDGSRRLNGQVCTNRPARMDELDELVWSEVLRLLEDPELIQAEIQRRLQSLRVEHPAGRRRDGLQHDLVRARRAVRRLIEVYQQELISLDELRDRSPALRKREQTLQAELDALDAELLDAESYLKLTETLDSFRQRLATNVETLSIEQRQQIIRLLVRDVLVAEDKNHHSPLDPGPPKPPNSGFFTAFRWSTPGTSNSAPVARPTCWTRSGCASLLEAGLLKASFVPPKPIRTLRKPDPVSQGADQRPPARGRPAAYDPGGHRDQALLRR